MQIKVEYLGNRELLEAHKTAFLCSRRVSSPAVLRCYDWATEACRSDGVVVSGFQSRIERDVLHFLLQGQKPLIVVIARRMYTVLASELQSAMDAPNCRRRAKPIYRRARRRDSIRIYRPR